MRRLTRVNANCPKVRRYYQEGQRFSGARAFKSLPMKQYVAVDHDHRNANKDDKSSYDCGNFHRNADTLESSMLGHVCCHEQQPLDGVRQG